jgi:hypothetical protein
MLVYTSLSWENVSWLASLGATGGEQERVTLSANQLPNVRSSTAGHAQRQGRVCLHLRLYVWASLVLSTP